MTKDEALKLALEALKWSKPHEVAKITHSEAIAALEEVLAQPAQEPLSDDSIFDFANTYLYNGGKSYGILEFARAIEAAQGIKE